MSDSDILDLMNFMAVVKIDELFSKFVNTIKSTQLAIYVNDPKDLECFIQRIYRLSFQNLSISYDLTKTKLKNFGHKSIAWLDQFKKESISVLRDAEVSLKKLLINAVKFSEENDIEQNMHEVFVFKIGKEKQNEIMSSSWENTFWNARLQDLNKKLSWNSKHLNPISLLPIMLCFFDKKEMNIKIGILRKEESCLNIIWCKNDFSTEDKHLIHKVHVLKYQRSTKFSLLNFVFEKILEKNSNLVSIEKQEIKINYGEVIYIGMTTSNSDINHFPENIEIKICPNNNKLHKWLFEEKHKTIYAFFIKSYHDGPFLGMAEVKNYNQSHLIVSWCLRSPNGLRLITEPNISKHLNDQFFVIENGKQLAEEYEAKYTEENIPSMAEVQNDGDKKQKRVDSLVNRFAKMSFEDIYQNVVQSKEKLPIQYFIFISQTSDYYLKLKKSISKNLQSFDESAMNLFFVTNENRSHIFSLHMLLYSNNNVCDFRDLQVITLKLLYQLTEEPISAGKYHPCKRGKDLLKLYYECLNPRPAHLLHTSNSCYLTSMLQCLKACFDLKEVDEIYDLLDKDKTPLSFIFFRLLYMMFRNKDFSINTTDLIQELGKYNNKFDSQSQQDGYDFLMCLIHNIERESIHYKDSIGIMSSKFAFEIQTTWKCEKDHVDATTQKDYAVIITPRYPMNGEVDLECCWKKMFCAEKMDEILCQKCPNKEELSEGELETSLKTLPKFLIVYINRWDPNKKSKNEDNLRFELNDFAVEKKGGIEHYEAVAFCNHLGSLDSGHYLAYVRGNKNNIWFECDDINDKHEAFMWNHRFLSSEKVYTIFYRKK